jgi:hypothetical protein
MKGVNNMRLFIAQPMTGKSTDEINLIRGIVARAFIDHLIEEEDFTTVELIDQVNLPDPMAVPRHVSERDVRLRCLGRSITMLGSADVVIFAGDWNSAKGCHIEKEICETYNIPIYDIKKYMKDHRYIGDRYELVFPELGEYEGLPDTDIYPVTIISDRYTGVYSGGDWTAWACDADDIPEGIFDSDVECANAWSKLKRDRKKGKIIFGVGNTPNEAMRDLIKSNNQITSNSDK